MRRLIALLLLAPSLLPAQTKPTLTPADYGQWQTLGAIRLSPRGDWLASGINRVNEENELQLRGGPRDTTIVVPFATQPTFSATNGWVAYLVGVSPKERDRLTAAKKPVRTTAMLRNLATGAVLQESEMQSVAFSPNGRFATMTRYAAEGKRTNDVLVWDLAKGTRLTFSNVSDQAWADASVGGGALLALTIEGDGPNGQSVQLYDAATNTLKVLASGSTPFRALAWRRNTADLAVMQSKPDKAFRDTTYAVQLFSGVSTACTCTPAVLDGRAVEYPADYRITEHRRPVWSADGRTLFVGLRLREPADKALKKSDEKPSDVEVWHTKDVRMFRQQMASEANDLRRTIIAAWHIAPNHLLPLTRDLNEAAAVLEGGRFVTEQDTKAYAWEMKFGRNVTDVYAINTNTGERTLIVKRTGHWYGGDPAGTRVAWGDGRDYWVRDLTTGKALNITASLTKAGKADFVDHDDDHPNPIPHQFAIGAWSKDGRFLFLNTMHDVWQVASDGSSARRLTDGARDDITYRVVTFAGFGASALERAIDADAPVTLSMFNNRTKASGWARVASGSVERLVYGDASYRSLVKADSAPVWGYVRGTFTESPNAYVGASLAQAKAMTATNPFQANYAWGKAELVNFTSTIGQKLQGILYYPANYDASRKYPLIVYTYELLSDGLHNYVVPNQTNYYNTTLFTQAGYFVLYPDIVFRPREPGLGTQYAVEGAVKTVLAQGHVDPARVGHVGHSQGGYEAAFLGTHSKLFATTVVGSGITDMVSFARQLHWQGGSAEFDHWETGQFRMQVAPWEDERAMTANSPLAMVHKMPAKAMLVMVGLDDGTVDPRQGSLFYNYARRAGKQVVLLQYPGEGHGLSKKENQRDYQTRILQWFGHYLKGDPAPTWIERGMTALERRAILDANK